jgi:hypothetical protein
MKKPGLMVGRTTPAVGTKALPRDSRAVTPPVEVAPTVTTIEQLALMEELPVPEGITHTPVVALATWALVPGATVRAGEVPNAAEMAMARSVAAELSKVMVRVLVAPAATPEEENATVGV